MRKQIKGLKKALLDRIVITIISHKPVDKILLFGSRAKGSFDEVSDIDIAIFSKDWADRDINVVKHDLEEGINTPLKFDVINFYAITKKSLKENILKEGRLIYEHKKD